MLRTRVWQIPVEVDGSWFVALLIPTAGFGWFARAVVPGTGVVAAAVLGLGVGLALTASLLFHELAHAYAARHSGIQIEHVRVFAGGALSRRQKEFDSAREQFYVAAAGPLVSVVTGGCVALLLPVARHAGVGVAVLIAMGFTAFANVLVALSNMLPVFPLDGGKLLHAHLWKRWGDRHIAAQHLERSGREFSRLVIVLGLLVMAFSGDPLIGIIIVALGWYLLRLPPPA